MRKILMLGLTLFTIAATAQQPDTIIVNTYTRGLIQDEEQKLIKAEEKLKADFDNALKEEIKKVQDVSNKRVQELILTCFAAEGIDLSKLSAYVITGDYKEGFILTKKEFTK